MIHCLLNVDFCWLVKDRTCHCPILQARIKRACRSTTNTTTKNLQITKHLTPCHSDSRFCPVPAASRLFMYKFELSAFAYVMIFGFKVSHCSTSLEAVSVPNLMSRFWRICKTITSITKIIRHHAFCILSNYLKTKYYYLYLSLTNPFVSRNLRKTERAVLDFSASWISCCLCLNVNFIFSKIWSLSAQWFIWLPCICRHRAAFPNCSSWLCKLLVLRFPHHPMLHLTWHSLCSGFCFRVFRCHDMYPWLLLGS